jgi:hypothetical protein
MLTRSIPMSWMFPAPRRRRRPYGVMSDDDQQALVLFAMEKVT